MLVDIMDREHLHTVEERITVMLASCFTSLDSTEHLYDVKRLNPNQSNWTVTLPATESVLCLSQRFSHGGDLFPALSSKFKHCPMAKVFWSVIIERKE